MIAWLKAIHIVALIVWCGGLLVLPTLLGQRNHEMTRGAVIALQRLTRVLFIQITSPAAFVAVVAGTVLIFMREVFTPFMMLKLVAVGVLVTLHIRTGYVILSVFKPHGRYAPWRQVVMLVMTLGVITTILLLILGKPAIDLAGLPPWLLQPGGLQSLLETIRPTP
jgi:protoporphyrinogen IX oxidase